MAVGDGWTSRLIAGLVQHLEDNAVGAYRPTGAYTVNEVAICQRLIPPAPDRAITIADYPVDSHPGMADITVGVQIRVRGTTDPRVCADIGDAIFDLLDSATHLQWGGISVVQIYRQSYTSLGQDANGRWESSHNFYVDAMRPTTNRFR
jgi:hypothetical protein